MHLPDWLQSGYTKALTGLFSGGSLATIVYKKLTSPKSPDFLLPILGVTGILLVVILLLVYLLRPHEKPVPAPAPAPGPTPAPAPAAYKATLHKED
jgi:drug/metabolite transporter (DMT)-like permease